MSDARSLTDTEVERVLDGIRHLVANHGGQLPAEKATKIKQRTMSKYLAREGRPGSAFAERLALALGKPRNFFRDDFQTESHVERPARYSNFELAAEVARREGIAEEAIERSRAALKADADLPVGEWLEDIRTTSRRMKYDARDPVGAAREEAAREEAAAAQQREDDAAKARGDTAQPGYRERLAEAKRRKK